MENTAMVESFVPDVQPIITVNADEDSLQMNSEEIRERVKKLRDSLAEDYIELCKLLWTVNKKRYYESWGFQTFKEYIAVEIEFRITKARYLVQMYENLHEKQADKTIFEKVLAVGWTKAKELVNVVTAENADMWVEKARNLNVEDLTKEVKRYLKQLISDDPTKAKDTADQVEGTAAEDVLKSITFQMHHDDYVALGEALEKVKIMQQGVSNSQALGLICRDFSATNPSHGEDVDVINFLGKYEKLFGLKFVVLNMESKEIVHGWDLIKEIAKTNVGNA